MCKIPSQVGQYIIKEQIDEGSFGICHFAENIETGDIICVKIVHCSEAAKTEFNILSKISHPNIVSLLDVHEEDGYFFIFMEFCDGMTLLDAINTYGEFSEEDAKYIFEQIVSALEYLHSNGISHGDIKLENIISNNEMNVKIVDFGFASESDILTVYRGSFEYSAPEILTMIPFEGKKADMWSAGVCFYGMLTGFLPFHEENVKDVINRICNRDFEIPEFISDETKYLIEHLLQIHPESRLTAKEVLKQEWNRYEVNETLYYDIPVDINY
jgi:serine/threonine protein kinase